MPDSSQDKAGSTVHSATDVIAMINEVTAPLTGGHYFRSLIARLAESLEVHAALATECLEYPENHVRTLAYWEGSDFAEDIRFDLAGTPCQHVIEDGSFAFYPERLGDYFPEWADEEGGMESFIGIPVLAPSDGRVVGHIAVYDSKPMPSDGIVESMFRIIAARAGAEIERMQAEQALRDSEARARQHLSELAHVSRLSTMGELASALAHEINQPLTALLTNCRTSLHLLEQAEPDIDELREAMSRSVDSADRARQVVRRLREYVRGGRTQRRLMPMRRLFEELESLLETETHHHRVDLSIELDPDLPRARVDHVLIQQVVLNLVRNGVDAINRSEGDRRTIRVSVSQMTEDRVEVAIRDSGPGVDPEMTDRLFEAFTSTRKDGMGIGLSLCRSIIENHEGELWLADSGSEGAEFRFSLPVARE